MSGFLAFGLSHLGHTEHIPAIAVAVSSIILFCMGTQQSQTIFSEKDWPLLASLPIPTRTIVCAKLLFVYLLLFSVNSIVVLPQIAVLQMLHATTIPLIFLILIFFITPLIPFVLGTLVNLGIVALTRRFRYLKPQHIYMLFSLIFGLIYIIGAFSLQDSNLDGASKETLIAIVNMVVAIITKVYVPAMLLLPEFIPLGYVNALLFIALSLAVFSTFVRYISKNYLKINASLTTQKIIVKKARKDKQSSHLGAFIRKELKLISQFPRLIMSMLFTYALFFLFCGILWFGGDITQLATFMPMTITLPAFEPSMYTLIYISVVGYFLLILTPYAYSAFSLEGKTLWIIQTLPVPFKKILLSKFLTMQIFLLPPIIIFIITLFAKQIFPISDIMIIALWLVAYAIFLTLSNLFINFMFPKYIWKSENEVHSFSTAGTISTFGHMITLGLVAFLVPKEIFMLGIPIVLCILSGAIFIWLSQQQLYLKGKQ